MGMNAAEIVPSPRRFCRKFGVLSATRRTSAWGPRPKKKLTARSRTSPITRERKMPAATRAAALRRGAAATAPASIPAAASASAGAIGTSSGSEAAPGGSGTGSVRSSCSGIGAGGASGARGEVAEVADGEVVAGRAEAGDHAGARGREHEPPPEGLPRVHVREVHLHHRHADGRDGVAEGDGRVAVAAGVDHDAAVAVALGGVEGVDQRALAVVLREGEVHVRERVAERAGDLVQRREAVDVRLAGAEEVE